jgi:hypothetical protein
LVDTVERGAMTLRAAYFNARLKFDLFDPLFAGFRQFGPQGVAIADQYDPANRRVTFFSAGGMYDPGKWFVTSEWGQIKVRSALGDRSGWYASGGYRFGALTPYVVYASTQADGNTSDPGLSLTGLPPAFAGAAAGLNAGLNTILAQIPVQRSVSVGARWDFISNVALKVQLDHDDLGAGSPGTLGNLQPGFSPGGSLNVFSATIDFVW